MLSVLAEGLLPRADLGGAFSRLFLRSEPRQVRLRSFRIQNSRMNIHKNARTARCSPAEMVRRVTVPELFDAFREELPRLTTEEWVNYRH